jgi:hypothetical protein
MFPVTGGLVVVRWIEVHSAEVFQYLEAIVLADVVFQSRRHRFLLGFVFASTTGFLYQPII